MYGVCTPKELVRLLETACVGCLVLTSLFMRLLTSSVAPLWFQIFSHLSAPSELEPRTLPVHKGVLVRPYVSQS
ncbi:uncharacterized protein HD556DRAFT_1539679 [Suillus plorans]|uniref:Uncharacterized protein n=1 Tax=Suillus plorans TaxID=116603 RepID=A0A9P7ABU1_9AGAM|nr:uncharacterized protein HD556DRAFT_1539679 [Suillus plorans]KAG1786226.1 hypothetical protein HD556DRAFT_1539679 [Suillus plorans]KAG1817881.1 hypothetical protein EV424DRAFT_1556702 [Suillus variegatus]